MYNENFKFKTYWKDDITCEVEVVKNSVTFKNYTDKWWKLPFGVLTSVTIDNVEEFFEDRCFPRE